MDILRDRLNKKLETTRKEKRQSRKEIRAKMVNSKRNLVFTESAEVEPVLSENEKLRLWRIEKKKKMEEEKLKRKPPFVTYINVKHTGFSPFKTRIVPLAATRNRTNRIVFNGSTEAANKVSDKVQEVEKKAFRAIEPQNKPLRTISSTKAKVPEVEKKATSAVPNNKLVKPSKLTNKTEKDAKLVKKPVAHKKELNKNKSQWKENKENLPNRITKLVPDKNCNNCGREKQYFTRSRKNIENAKNAKLMITNASNGPVFQRERLEEETKKLQELRDHWLLNAKKNVPKEIHDEILSVTGLTTLLITSKFEQFRSLINDCETQLTTGANEQQKITPDDLDGFWEMMFLQVVQLHNKYMRLEKLMLNNWVDPDEIRRNKTKKPIIKTPMPKKNGQSRFQEFLAKRKQYNEKTLENHSPSLEDKSVDLQFSHVTEAEVMNSSLLKNCRVTPKAVNNLIKARKSRRSSMNLIMSMSGLGKFDISGTALPSPNTEKK